MDRRNCTNTVFGARSWGTWNWQSCSDLCERTLGHRPLHLCIGWRVDLTQESLPKPSREGCVLSNILLQDRKESDGMASWKPCYMKAWVSLHPVAAHKHLTLQKHLEDAVCCEWWCSIGLGDAGWHPAERGRGLRKESKWKIAFGALKARR